MERRRIPLAFVGGIGDTNNEEQPFFEDDADGQFEYSERQHEFVPNKQAYVRETRYEYQNIAPFKRPQKPAGNRYEARSRKSVGHHQMKPLVMTPTKSNVQNFPGKYQLSPIPFDKELTVSRKQTWREDRGVDPLSEAFAPIPATYSKTAENFLARDDIGYNLQMDKEIANQQRNVHFTTSAVKRTRNTSPAHSSVEPRPAKMTPMLSSQGSENGVHEKDDGYWSSNRTCQQKYGARSYMTPSKQSTKDDEPLSKSEQSEKRTPPSDENTKLKEALEKSKAVSRQLENELKKHESGLAQATQTKQNLQDQVTELDKEKQKKITDFHQHYRTANTILKMQEQFDAKIELLAGFLSNESKLKETIASVVSPSSWKKLQETLKFYQRSREEMKTIKQSCHEMNEKLRKTVEETFIDEQMESDFKQLCEDFTENFILCREKRIQMQLMNEKTQEEIMRLNAEADRVKAVTDSERDQMQAKFTSLSKLVKLEAESARKRKDLIKDKALKQIAKQKEVITSLKNEYEDVKTEVERVSAECRDLESENGRLKLKYEEVDAEYVAVNHELKELTEKLDALCGQINSKTRPMLLQIKNTNEKLQEMKLEKEQLQTKKLELNKKIEHLQSVQEYKNKIAELEDQLKTNAQIKKTMEEFRGIMKRQLQEKDSRISAATEKANALKEKRRELWEQFNARNDSLMQEKKASVDMLASFSCITGQQSLRLEALELEVSATEDEIIKTLYSIADLELEQEQLSKENKRLDDTYRTKRKALVEVMCEKERCDNEIRMIKKFVRDKLYTTVQEINKNINEVVKRREVEEAAGNELEEYVNQHKLKLEELKKQKNLSQKKADE